MDINVSKGDELVKEITKEIGPNKCICIKTDVTKADQLEGNIPPTKNFKLFYIYLNLNSMWFDIRFWSPKSSRRPKNSSKKSF